MRKNGPPKGLVSYLVLELLEEKPRYGYEILKEITELSGGHWEPSYGSIYPLLYKFEENGWAERCERDEESERKYFRLTEAGETELEHKRAEAGQTARDLHDSILGFYHLFVNFASDDRFEISVGDDEWGFDERFSRWICEQVIRHHERDYGEFERLDETPEEFYERVGVDPDG
jgi:DNA-binding PadR family transcriptional regulator